MWKKIILGMIVCCGFFFAYYYFNTTLTNTNYSILNTIRSKIDGRQELKDYDNEIGVKSIDDIGFTIKKDKIYLYYGKMEFELGSKELMDEEFMNGMKQIGIEIKKKKNGKYKITYWGKDVREWVN